MLVACSLLLGAGCTPDDPTPADDDDSTAAADDDTSNPGDDDTTDPGDDDTTKPGDDDSGTPGDDDSAVPGDDDVPPTAEVGPDGGAIETEGGSRVDVPADALPKGVELSIEQAVAPEELGAAALPEDLDAVTTVLVTPHGTEFALPSLLSLPSGNDLGAAWDERVVMSLSDLSDVSWEPEGPVGLVGNTATLEIDGFSAYSLATVAAGACPCWTGAELRDWSNAASAASVTQQYARLSGLSSDTKSCSFYTGTTLSAEHTVIEDLVGFEYTCTSWGEAAYGGEIPSTQLVLNADEHAACWGLMRAVCDYNRNGVQLAAYATDIPPGESVSVTVTTTDPAGAQTTTPLTMVTNNDLHWLADVFDPGTTYDVIVTAQPASATCQPLATPGALTSANAAVEVACVLNPPPLSCPCYALGDFDTAFTAAQTAGYPNAECGDWVDPTESVTAIFFGDPCPGPPANQWGFMGAMVESNGTFTCVGSIPAFVPPVVTETNLSLTDFQACQQLVWDWGNATGNVCPEDSCLY